MVNAVISAISFILEIAVVYLSEDSLSFDNIEDSDVRQGNGGYESSIEDEVFRVD